MPRSLDRGDIGGVLVHGNRPSAKLAKKLSKYPTVWILRNFDRPQWGDSVMPDHSLAGEMAAGYLARRGHRHVACLTVNSDGSSLEMSAWSFDHTASEIGITSHILSTDELPTGDRWSTKSLMRVAEDLVDQLLSLSPVPSGMFIFDDRLLAVVESTLADRGLRTGPFGDVEIISCNSDRTSLPSSCDDRLATIDLRSEVVGRRGLEQLIWRMNNPECSERMSLLIEPELISYDSVQAKGKT